jgi:hypothetical protein
MLYEEKKKIKIKKKKKKKLLFYFYFFLKKLKVGGPAAKLGGLTGIPSMLKLWLKAHQTKKKFKKFQEQISKNKITLNK